MRDMTHIAYPKAQQRKDATDLDLEDWLAGFPGRVEKVEPARLYIVRLDEADGELLLGLAATEGPIFQKSATDDGRAGAVAMEPHIKALWFKRRNDKAFGWGQNPAFEKYMDGRERISDELPVESFLLEVTEGDLTDDGAANMWELPKLKEVFKRKLMMLAAKYGLVATRATEKAAPAQSSSAKAPTKRATEHATPGALSSKQQKRAASE